MWTRTAAAIWTTTPALLGLARKEGTRAYAEIRFTGRDGVVVPEGTVFLTGTGLEYSLVSAVMLKNGKGTGYLRAAEVGDAYNAGQGEITQILRNISGLEGWSNEAAQGGTDPEGDEAVIPAHRPAAQGPGHQRQRGPLQGVGAGVRWGGRV